MPHIDSNAQERQLKPSLFSPPNLEGVIEIASDLQANENAGFMLARTGSYPEIMFPMLEKDL